MKMPPCANPIPITMALINQTPYVIMPWLKVFLDLVLRRKRLEKLPDIIIFSLFHKNSTRKKNKINFIKK